jgi:hypothetical protein
MTLGQAIEKDILKMTSSRSKHMKEAVSRIQQEYESSIDRLNKSAMDPNGHPRIKLTNKRYISKKQKAGKKNAADFNYTSKAYTELTSRYGTVSGSPAVKFEYPAKVYNYMITHEEGTAKYKRRQFPNENDSQNSGSPAGKLVDKTGEILERMLNKPRTLKAKATVTRLG